MFGKEVALCCVWFREKKKRIPGKNAPRRRSESWYAYRGQLVKILTDCPFYTLFNLHTNETSKEELHYEKGCRNYGIG